MKILHTADLHLGQILYQYYDRTDEHDHFFQQLSHWCTEYSPDALLLCGDVFDIPQPSAATKEHFNQAMASLHKAFPSMSIVIIAGNHDSAARLQADSVVWQLSGVTLLGQAPPHDALELPEGWQDRFIIELPSGFIAAIPFSAGSRSAEVQSVLDRIAQRNTEQKPVVLCGHLAMLGSDPTGHSDIGQQRVFNPEEMGSGYDYLALGHIHRPQSLGHSLEDEHLSECTYPSPLIRYSGSALHVNCDERYPHSVSLVDIPRHGADIHLHRLPIDQLRHFYILPPEDLPPAHTTDEALALVRSFCSHPASGYFRLRLDHSAATPADFFSQIYSILDPTQGEARFNPNIIWEGITDTDRQTEKILFQVAELQQMEDPLDFVSRTIDLFPEFTIETLRRDFAEVEQELRAADEAPSAHPSASSRKTKQTQS